MFHAMVRRRTEEDLSDVSDLSERSESVHKEGNDIW